MTDTPEDSAGKLARRETPFKALYEVCAKDREAQALMLSETILSERARAEKAEAALAASEAECAKLREERDHLLAEEQSAIEGRDKIADIAIAARKQIEEARADITECERVLRAALGTLQEKAQAERVKCAKSIDDPTHNHPMLRWLEAIMGPLNVLQGTLAARALLKEPSVPVTEPCQLDHTGDDIGKTCRDRTMAGGEQRERHVFVGCDGYADCKTPDGCHSGGPFAACGKPATDPVHLSAEPVEAPSESVEDRVARLYKLLAEAKRLVETWPAWKQDWLRTPAEPPAPVGQCSNPNHIGKIHLPTDGCVNFKAAPPAPVADDPRTTLYFMHGAEVVGKIVNLEPPAPAAPDPVKPKEGGMSEGEQGPWPWLAWARTVPSWRGLSSPVDHATLDGVTTLCGMKEVGGSDRSVAFSTAAATACRRCLRQVSR